MKDNGIEELFKNGLLESESDVPGGTWKAIENSLDTMMPAAGAASQPTSSLGILGKAVIGGVILSGIALTAYLFNTEKSEPISEHSATVEKAAEMNDTDVNSEVVTDIQKSSVKFPAVVSHSEEVEKISQESFTANDEIKPFADQSEEVKAELPASETMPEVSEPTSESITKENVLTDNVLPAANNSFEPIAVESNLLPEVSFNDVITPNLDNVNDIFRVEGNEAVSTFTVTVMNLNGKVLHQWSAPNGFWDGKLENGQMAPSGKYLVDIFVQPLKGTPYHKPVTIQLIR